MNAPALQHRPRAIDDEKTVIVKMLAMMFDVELHTLVARMSQFDRERLADTLMGHAASQRKR